MVFIVELRLDCIPTRYTFQLSGSGTDLRQCRVVRVSRFGGYRQVCRNRCRSDGINTIAEFRIFPHCRAASCLQARRQL